MRSPRRPIALAASALLSVFIVGACGSPVSTPPHTAPASPSAEPSPPSTNLTPHVSAALKALEKKFGARLGVYAVDVATDRLVAYHALDRFAFASTAKALSAGLLLRRDPDAALDTRVRYTKDDILAYAPVTSKHVTDGMTVRQLLAAALQYSDNTAANLIVERLGGPHAVQGQLRALGDATTHVDRLEPDLNEATPGDVRDTTTPTAIANDLRGLMLGDLLGTNDRRLLTDFMLGNTTGGPYIRAGVPATWRVADKTGNGSYGTRNDIAVLWRPNGDPVVLAVLSDRGRQDATSDDGLIADTTRTVLAALGT